MRTPEEMTTTTATTALNQAVYRSIYIVVQYGFNHFEESLSFLPAGKKARCIAVYNFYLSVLHFTLRMNLGMQKAKFTAQLMLLIFSEETLASHFKKQLRFDILQCNPFLKHFYNYQTLMSLSWNDFKNPKK